MLQVWLTCRVPFQRMRQQVHERTAQREQNQCVHDGPLSHLTHSQPASPTSLQQTHLLCLWHKPCVNENKGRCTAQSEVNNNDRGKPHGTERPCYVIEIANKIFTVHCIVLTGILIDGNCCCERHEFECFVSFNFWHCYLLPKSFVSFRLFFIRLFLHESGCESIEGSALMLQSRPLTMYLRATL